MLKNNVCFYYHARLSYCILYTLYHKNLYECVEWYILNLYMMSLKFVFMNIICVNFWLTIIVLWIYHYENMQFWRMVQKLCHDNLHFYTPASMKWGGILLYPCLCVCNKISIAVFQATIICSSRIFCILLYRIVWCGVKRFLMHLAHLLLFIKDF